jgi:hypothetical protein
MTFAVYTFILLIREDTQQKGLAFVTPIFLIFCDLVILTLREKPTSIESEAAETTVYDFLYSTAFQSMVLLAIRCFLCFNKEQWLIQFSMVYVLIQTIAAFDMSHSIFAMAGQIGTDQEQILKLYQQVPLLQAKVRGKIVDL